jgi:DNA topoisomerase I
MRANRSRRKLQVTLLPSDPYESAKIAGLRYVSAEDPGIRRKRNGKGFTYLSAGGRPVRDPQVLARIRSLVIPPAWGNVWICTSATGHIQAIGYDARGRKQYRYHPLYRAVRDATKFTRLVAFGLTLPKIRESVAADLKLSGLPRRKVLATVVQLLEDTCIRVGNEEYAKENASFGLTTLRNKHVQINGQTLRFHFKGKSGQLHDVELTDRRLARILRECQCIPGQELFQFIGEDGQPCKITSDDVNDYLREVTGEDFTAKEFRTWNGTREGVKILEALGPGASETAAKKNIVEAVKQTAERLGNRPATCKKYYIHPAILDAYVDGSLFEVLRSAESQRGPFGLAREEVALMQLLAMHKPGPLKRIEEERDLTPALRKSVEQVVNVADIEVVQPVPAVA